MSGPLASPNNTETVDALRDQMDVLVRVCNRLNDPRPTDQILDDLLKEAQELLGAEAGTVFVRQGDGLRFVCCQNSARGDLRVKPDCRSDLGSGFKRNVIPLTPSSLAGYVATTGESLRIEDAYAIPDEAPYSFDTTVDKASGYTTRSLLVIPLASSGSEPIGVLEFINKRDENGGVIPFEETDEQIATALTAMASLLVKNTQLHEHLQKVQLDAICRLAQAAEFRDDDTGAHIQRVSMYCEMIARELGMPDEFCKRILFAAPMHDVGKLAIPDAVLKKPGKLDEDEFDVMRTHTKIGGRILSGASDELIRMAERIALSHHEKWDGSGYPKGLSGDSIPIEGRITAVADVFDALTSRRVYKPPFPFEKAFQIIESDAGVHFDPDAVRAFLEHRDSVVDIHEAYAD